MFSLILKSAFTSLYKRSLRTILVIVMISVSLWALLFMQGYYDGMVKQMIDNAIRSDSAEVSIFAKDFRSTKDIKNQILNENQIIQKLNNNENVKNYSSRVISDALIATARYSKNAKIYGIDLQKEKAQANLDKYIKKGSYSFEKRNKGAIIGYQLAKKLKVDIGKKVIITAQNINNEVSSISLKVTGIIKTNNMFFDESVVFINKEKSKEFLGLSGISQISIFLNDYNKVVDFKNSFKDVSNIEIYDWGELYPALLQTKEMMAVFNFISYLIVFLTATIGIFGVILVSVLERLREFAILKAIGTKFKIVALMILFESFLIGIIGFIIGSFLGWITLYYFSIYGLDLSSFESALDEFGIDAITYPIIQLEYFITAFFAVFSAIFLSILFPLKVLKKSKPVEVING